MTRLRVRPEPVWLGLSAVLLVLAFPPFDLHALAWIALVPLLLVIRRSPPLGAALASLAAGFAFYAGLVWWALLIDGFHLYNFTLCILGNAVYVGAFGLTAAYFQARIPRWNALTFPATWVALEYVRANAGFLAFPWGTLGYSQYAVIPVAQIAAVAGVYGVSFVIVTANTVVAELVRACLVPSSARPTLRVVARASPLGVLAAAVTLTAVLLLSGFSAHPEERRARTIRVALVQGDVYTSAYTRERRDPTDRQAIFRKYHALTMRLREAGPRLIAWPESSVPGSLPSDATLLHLLSDLAQKTDAYLLVGASGHDKLRPEPRAPKRVANSAFLLSPRGTLLGRYDKRWLLPFNEYLPLRGYVRWPSWIAGDMADAEPGREATVFAAGEQRFGVLICWENLFPGLFRQMAARGVDFMVSMTNETFIDVPAARHQMLAMNVFRAIENHVSIVRVATTGVSAIIDPSGRIVARVRDADARDVNVQGALVGELTLTSRRTLYTRYGDWLIYTLPVVLAAFVTWASVAEPAPRSGARPHGRA